MPIYVGIRVRGSMDDLWRLTQTPTLHEQWDLRFTSIEYLEESEPQRFRYATRLGVLTIEGWGETAGDRSQSGIRSSALKFGSDDRRSLIHSGSGYWTYQQQNDGAWFATGYDYQVRWGFFGRAVDRVVFRPLIGWATAWSFDRLRLWIERDVSPKESARRALVHLIATVSVALVWIWQGLVPKLLGPHPDELSMLAEAGLPAEWLHGAALTLGFAEVLFGLIFMFASHRRWPWVTTVALMLAATVGVAMTSPEHTVAAFNPLALNLSLASLAVVGFLCLKDLPSARQCLRRPPGETGP